MSQSNLDLDYDDIILVIDQLEVLRIILRGS
jgi:hypothetical protein